MTPLPYFLRKIKVKNLNVILRVNGCFTDFFFPRRLHVAGVRYKYFFSGVCSCNKVCVTLSGLAVYCDNAQVGETLHSTEFL